MTFKSKVPINPVGRMIFWQHYLRNGDTWIY